MRSETSKLHVSGVTKVEAGRIDERCGRTSRQAGWTEFDGLRPLLRSKTNATVSTVP